MNFDATRTVSSMTLMAYERMPTVFISKLLQNAAQLALTFLLIEPLGVVGAIVAKGAGHIVNAAVLFFGLARLDAAARVTPPPVFYTGQIVVALTGFVAWRLGDPSIGVSCLLVIVALAGLWLAGGYRVDDLRSMLPSRFARKRASA
jgi:hypothetical protein